MSGVGTVLVDHSDVITLEDFNYRPAVDGVKRRTDRVVEAYVEIVLAGHKLGHGELHANDGRTTDRRNYCAAKMRANGENPLRAEASETNAEFRASQSARRAYFDADDHGCAG